MLIFFANYGVNYQNKKIEMIVFLAAKFYTFSLFKDLDICKNHVWKARANIAKQLDKQCQQEKITGSNTKESVNRIEL